ncbi:MAG: SDR family NAD(P)-dependent oxidoreductase, partial [Rubrobacteraceae bacterium]|nr:SDR family NAD(P)-dependent oxidoreductase [Rubrobacteraceae bacterium]
MEIRDCSFIVTGGGSGLGAATARMLAGEGAGVVIAEINEEAGSKTASELGERAVFVRTDVTDEKSMDAAVAQAGRLGTLRGLVNCAGIGPAARVVGRKGVHDLDLFARTIRVNLIGTFNAIRLAGAVMAENEPTRDGERGVIV